MVSILFLDDQWDRWDVFYRRFMSTTEIHWVKTAEECMQKMEERSWDIVSLDHDLGTEKNGMDVVRYMLAKLPSVGVIAIHSWNQPAASIMHSELYHSHEWEGNLYREVFGEDYLVHMRKIVELFPL